MTNKNSMLKELRLGIYLCAGYDICVSQDLARSILDFLYLSEKYKNSEFIIRSSHSNNHGVGISIHKIYRDMDYTEAKLLFERYVDDLGVLQNYRLSRTYALDSEQGLKLPVKEEIEP